jgi:uncharacterized protein YeaO (DUF488 family)
MGLRLKRAYEEPASSDGLRIPVDRLWPRGLKKEEARLASWLKDLAPSHELRRSYGHRPELWEEFKQRYAQELEAQSALLAELAEQAQRHTITLIYAARDETRNNAVALKEVLEALMKSDAKNGALRRHGSSGGKGARRQGRGKGKSG